MSVKHTVKLKKYLDTIIERVANAAIEPGMLVEIMSTNKVRKHATKDGHVLPMFALEDELQGKGLTDAYAADDQVQIWVAQRGEEVYALLEDGQVVAIGDFLVSAGNGHLQKQIGTGASDYNPTMKICGMALEAMDTSQSSGGDFPQRHLKIMVV
jgi:hypothetical protein